MKKFFTKIKTCLAAFRVALISFPLKANGLKANGWVQRDPQPDYWIYYPSEILYWVPSPVEQTTTIIDTIIKIVPRLLIAITFIVWIISFIKIRKIDDKILKKKKIKNTIIVISILIILIVILLLLPRFLKKYL